MCLLTFLPPAVLPDPAALRNGVHDNDDGHGFAIVARGRLLVRHAMQADALIEEFLESRHRHPDGPALFHSRLATDGSRSLGNCHPFALGNDPRTVLAHNGVFPDVVRPAAGDRRSDTRIVAEDFLPAVGSLSHPSVRERFERWMRPVNRVVILTVNRRFREQAYLFNEGRGTWDAGIWYSNHDYRPPVPPAERLRGGAFDALEALRSRRQMRCRCCHSVLDLSDDTCAYCGVCLDCDEVAQACGCPGRAATVATAATAATAATVSRSS